MNETETKYYLGGYYLTRLRPKTSGDEKGNLIYTCSECINDHILDVWSYRWTTDNNQQIEDIKNDYGFTNDQIDEIRTWVNQKSNDNKIGFLNVFTDLGTAIEYKRKFFDNIKDVKVFALYFDTTERTDILKEFKPLSEKFGEIGLRLTLLQEIGEQEGEVLIGYDYIGIENGGSFHTFHCHDIGKLLSDKFGLTLNKFGLFENDTNSKQVLDYLNDEENGYEPVPWFIVKTKLVTNE